MPLKLVKGGGGEFFAAADYLDAVVVAIGPRHEEIPDSFNPGEIRDIAVVPEMWVVDIDKPTASVKLTNQKITGLALAPAFYMPNPDNDAGTCVYGRIEKGQAKSKGQNPPYILATDLDEDEEGALEDWFELYENNDPELDGVASFDPPAAAAPVESDPEAEPERPAVRRSKRAAEPEPEPAPSGRVSRRAAKEAAPVEQAKPRRRL